MKAIILAAGRGSRMRELTDDRPKCLVEVQGRPLIEWQIQAIRKSGIKDIGIVTGYKRELLQHLGLTEFYNDRWCETNMVSSLSCAESWLCEGPCVVSYSDIFYGDAAIKALIQTDALLAITYDPNWRMLWERRFTDPLSDAETFRIDAEGNLIEIGGRASSFDEIQGQYMGLLRLTPQGWRTMQDVRRALSSMDRDRLQMTHLLQKVIDGGSCAISTFPYHGAWGEFDSADDVAAYHA